MRKPKPIVNFTDTPPIELTCGQKRIINFRIRPRAVGNCTASFTLSSTKYCSFTGGGLAVEKTETCTDADQSIDSSVEIEINCTAGDTTYLLLYVTATNEIGKESYRKAIEVFVEC